MFIKFKFWNDVKKITITFYYIIFVKYRVILINSDYNITLFISKYKFPHFWSDFRLWSRKHIISSISRYRCYWIYSVRAHRESKVEWGAATSRALRELKNTPKETWRKRQSLNAKGDTCNNCDLRFSRWRSKARRVRSKR